jgi:dihydrofolate reductase
MPELMVDFITSLEGYGAADGWPGWWGLEGPEYLAWLGDQPEADYTVLMGANTYRLMSGLAADGEAGTDALADMSKVVFSSTLTEPLSWPNTSLVSRDAVEAVREMKQSGSESMRTIGSVSLCRSLLSAGLVDRFRVVVFPVITGSTGKDRIYDGYPDVSLDMVNSRVLTVGCSCSSTSQRFWRGRLKRQRNRVAERTPLLCVRQSSTCRRTPSGRSSWPTMHERACAS